MRNEVAILFKGKNLYEGAKLKYFRDDVNWDVTLNDVEIKDFDKFFISINWKGNKHKLVSIEDQESLNWADSNDYQLPLYNSKIKKTVFNKDKIFVKFNKEDDGFENIKIITIHEIIDNKYLLADELKIKNLTGVVENGCGQIVGQAYYDLPKRDFSFDVDWRNAPRFAMFSTINECGLRIWHERIPVIIEKSHWWSNGQSLDDCYPRKFATQYNSYRVMDWKNSLVKRPNF